MRRKRAAKRKDPCLKYLGNSNISHGESTKPININNNTKNNNNNIKENSPTHNSKKSKRCMLCGDYANRLIHEPEHIAQFVKSTVSLSLAVLYPSIYSFRVYVSTEAITNPFPIQYSIDILLTEGDPICLRCLNYCYPSEYSSSYRNIFYIYYLLNTIDLFLYLYTFFSITTATNIPTPHNSNNSFEGESTDEEYEILLEDEESEGEHLGYARNGNDMLNNNNNCNQENVCSVCKSYEGQVHVHYPDHMHAFFLQRKVR